MCFYSPVQCFPVFFLFLVAGHDLCYLCCGHDTPNRLSLEKCYTTFQQQAASKHKPGEMFALCSSCCCTQW
jgi:hypothetical protein